MKAIAALVVLVSVGISIITASPVIESEFSDQIIDDTINDNFPITIGENDVKIYFYNQENPSEDVQINITDIAAVQNTSFDNTKRTFFITHGWNSDHTKPVCTAIRDAYLKNHDVNIFCVDWSTLSSKLYPQSFAQVEPVGKKLASMIEALENNNGLDLGKTALIGHSLGAHASGVAGDTLDGRLDYIVGMDPAGPLFLYDSTSNRLSPSSAQFVQVIHTCGSELGFFKPLGMADFYPNGGMKQNGCGLDVTGVCSHSRSYYYFAESIEAGPFIGQKCNSYDEFEKGNSFGSSVVMGGYNIDKSARGSYYLDVNDEAPFAKTNKTTSRF